MSAREILEQIKTLPPEEQEAFVELFHRWELAGNGAGKPAPQPVSLPNFAARRRRIFGDTVLPENLATAARREERW